MEKMDGVSIFFLDSVAIMHIVCVFLIRKFLRKKPLGMQTLVDLFMINTLIVQCFDVINHTVLLNLAVLSNHPINETIAISLTFVAEIVLTVDCCFLLFNVLIKYVCIYHSSIQEMIPDGKIIKTIWIFSTILSLILVITEFTFVHKLQTSGIYNCLRHQWSAKQEARYFVNLIFLLIISIYLYLQIRIKGCSYLNSKSKELILQLITPYPSFQIKTVRKKTGKCFSLPNKCSKILMYALSKVFICTKILF